MPASQVHSCSRCTMNRFCLPLGLDKKELSQLEALVKTTNTMHNGDYIFRQGDTFNKIFAVKSGMLKSVTVDEQGRENIIGFHLPGELIGLDGIYPENYLCSTSAIETSVLCAMDYEKLTDLCSNSPKLQRQLLRQLSRDIYDSHIEYAMRKDQTAEQKLAGFIQNLSHRMHLRGYSAKAVKLSMTRQDIANHLGITPETVSRILKRFKQQDILDVRNRMAHIQDFNRLEQTLDCPHA